MVKNMCWLRMPLTPWCCWPWVAGRPTDGNRLAMGTPAPLLPAWAAAPADAAALLLGWQVVGAATLGWGAAAATGAEAAAALSLQGTGASLLLVMYTKLRSTVWRRSAAALLLACLSCPN